MKDHVKILLLGDDGVGKSSLISTYVSRHFPEEVPNLMTDTVITADKTADDVIVTIMDSSSR
jgi:GTPase SAR1 family protein